MNLKMLSMKWQPFCSVQYVNTKKPVWEYKLPVDSPCTKRDSYVEHLCFLCCWLEQAVEQTVELPLIKMPWNSCGISVILVIMYFAWDINHNFQNQIWNCKGTNKDMKVFCFQNQIESINEGKGWVETVSSWVLCQYIIFLNELIGPWDDFRIVISEHNLQIKLIKLLSVECHRKLLLMSQHWFR